MGAYILRRILLMIPTILGILAISFAVIQFAPGGPIERIAAELGHPEPETVVSGGLQILEKWRGLGVVTGTLAG